MKDGRPRNLYIDDKTWERLGEMAATCNLSRSAILRLIVNQVDCDELHLRLKIN